MHNKIIHTFAVFGIIIIYTSCLIAVFDSCRMMFRVTLLCQLEDKAAGKRISNITLAEEKPAIYLYNYRCNRFNINFALF